MTTTLPLANSLHRATLDALRRQAPFATMNEDVVLWLIQRLSVAYFERDAVLLEPADAPPDTLFIIKQGTVGGVTADGQTVFQLATGEIFPLGALLAGRGVANRYVAVSDTFCYLLPAADFHALLTKSPEFHDFCTRRIASLLEESQRAVQSEYALALDDEHRFARPLASLIRRAPLSVLPDTPLANALHSMEEARIGSVVVTDAAGMPVGILTLKDVLGRVTLAGVPLSTPISAVMTPNPATLSADVPVADALVLMARQGIHHLPLVSEGRLVGVVSEKDIFALRRLSVEGITSALSRADDPARLPALAHDIGDLAHSLLAQGMDAENLTAIISGLNDRVTERIIALESEPDHALAGLRWCWLALGSEGRMEQTLATDQDNALIFHAADAAQHAALLAFAQRVNARLDACGFPLCKGGIMAGNPQWCLSVTDWQRQFAQWIDHGSPEALLHASIFFDFRPLAGDAALALDLRAWLSRAAQKNPRFLHQMAGNALRNRPPLGVVRDFVLSEDEAHPHTLDLKLNGATPFVDAARIFALASGSPQTNTAKRLREAARALHIPDSELADWNRAFHFLQLLRLRHQHTQQRAGQIPDNHVNPDSLNPLDRRILKEALRQARKVQARLALDYKL
ncbi:MAG: signal-transduction protein [Proteobacteria bacterium]|nr:signal-transduction protein [Pseudomonadota bacterium]